MNFRRNFQANVQMFWNAPTWKVLLLCVGLFVFSLLLTLVVVVPLS